MGEMADYTLEQGVPLEEMSFDYRIGGVSVWDAYDAGIIDEFGRELRTVPSGHGSKVCRCCGVGALHWGLNSSGKWRLYDEFDRLHACKVHPLTE